MAGLNKAILIGHLGLDPELKFTQNGQAVLRLRLATTEVYFNRAKEKQERTEWHTVIVWGNRAEGLNKILAKGKQLFVEGRIQTRSWEDKDGNKRYNTEVVATEIILLGSGGRGADSSARSSNTPEAYGEPAETYGGGGGAPAAEFGEDDIPF